MTVENEVVESVPGEEKKMEVEISKDEKKERVEEEKKAEA